MMFSVIMPSFLGNYPGCASNRRDKLIRAIESVRSQTFQDWELIICADGCKETYDLVCSNYHDDTRIQCLLIEKRQKFDPEIRNLPIRYSTGEWTTYLDSDDYMGPNHLSLIAGGIAANTGADWLFYNDWIPTKGWTERQCKPVASKCGTSNITHRNGLPVKWSSSVYGQDDWKFIQELKRLYPNSATIPATQYYVCHLPGKFDV